MEQVVDFPLNRRHDLNTAAPGTYDGHPLPVQIVAFFVVGAVHQLASKVMQALDVRPLPAIQNAAGVDEEVGAVVDHLVCF
jgi:hypothetical protein